MKKTFLLITSLLISLSSFAQVYQDNSNKGAFYIYGEDNGYVVTVNDGISAACTNTTQYQAFGLGIGTDFGAEEVLDISANPLLYIKAKGTGDPVLRIDLQDVDGYSTSAAGLKTNITANYDVYIFDFNGNFVDQYSPVCAADPQTQCPVDASQISGIQISTNPDTGGYTGTLDIEWISFGNSLEDLPEATQYDLRYNQLGYTVGQQKLVSIIGIDGTFSNKSYDILNSSNQSVMSGTTVDSRAWSASGENSFSVDISTLDTPGTYTFSIDEKSISFKILEDPYAELREEAFKYYYYNRASTELTQQYAGAYARPTGIPDTDVKIHKSAVSPGRAEGFSISAPKGWYDAGDYNKYIVNSGISTYTLLAAYEHYSAYFSQTAFSIPETGGDLPDILDEVKWNLDWMLAMQDPYDGGVYHKLTGLGFSSGTVMPADYNIERFVVQKSTAASLDFAAVMATAARIYESYDADYSSQMLQAAKDAYTWAKANPTAYYEQLEDSDAIPANPLLNDVQTGEYPDDGRLDDEFQWAAVELYISTEESTYANDFTASSINGGVPGWQNVATLALLSIAHHSDNLPSEIATAGSNNLLSIAGNLKTIVETSAMNVAMGSADFVWGSNGVAGNQIMLLINAYKLSNDSSYLDAAYIAIDYLFGRNGTNYSFVTGFGDLFPVDPHHRISYASNYTIPGMIVGGPHYPNFELGGECDVSQYPSTEQAKSYLDDWCSYSRNEVTINWNAPLVYSLHAMRAIQTGNDGTLSNADNYNEAFAEKFAAYPNPTIDTLSVKSLEGIKDAVIEIFTLKGEKISTSTLDNDNSTIDLSNSAPGIYILQITQGKQSYTTKIVKE